MLAQLLIQGIKYSMLANCYTKKTTWDMVVNIALSSLISLIVLELYSWNVRTNQSICNYTFVILSYTFPHALFCSCVHCYKRSAVYMVAFEWQLNSPLLMADHGLYINRYCCILYTWYTEYYCTAFILVILSSNLTEVSGSSGDSSQMYTNGYDEKYMQPIQPESIRECTIKSSHYRSRAL